MTRDTNERHGHPAVLAANDLHAIVSLWPELEARVPRGGGNANEERTGKKPKKPGASPIPISPHVVDVISEVDQWAVFLARVLMDETTTETPWPGPLRGSWVDPWAPPKGERTPDILRAVVERVGHFTEHEDAELAQAFTDDAARLLKLVERTARPSGRRTLSVGAKCFEHPCRGNLTVLADPESPYVVPDVICDRETAHRITPAEWMRAYRRKGEAQGATDLVAEWRRQERSMTA